MADSKKKIIVGVDGSNESLEAARWAARRAQEANTPLEVICAYALPSYTAASMDSGFAAIDDESIKDSAQLVVDNTIAELKSLPIEISGRVIPGDPTGILVELSSQAELMVVGTRGGGGFADRLLGATSSALPAYSACPVAVIPKAPKDSSFLPVQKIVIGIDGSKRSRSSLRVAIREAEIWDAQLTAVEAVPMASAVGALSWLPAAVDRDSILKDVRKELKEICAQESAGSEIKIRAHALDGNAAALLTEFSTAVDLVVVGTRGRGGFAGVLMGSTSQSVLAHAACPVLVVPTLAKEDVAKDPKWDRPAKD